MLKALAKAGQEPNAMIALPLTDFDGLRKEYVRPLIELNDRVNILTATETKINSTRIVVAGDQSHGKTSLLEALSGIDLPRGEGIVTRVPLILQLRGINNGETESATLSTKLGEEKEIIMESISEEIALATEKLAGPGKDVQNKPITVKIFRKEQDDLTLIDLPGITRVALEDQAGGDNQKLEKCIMDMCREYMAPEESILLNVVNALVDFTTSASLALSRELDPEGSRTMLCITKVDQYPEKDTFHLNISKSIAAMKLKPEHVFCVRNRSERENEQGMSREDVRKHEMNLLHDITKNENGHVEYQLGVRALSKALVKRQCQEIRSTLPQTLRNIQDLERSLKEEYIRMGAPIQSVEVCRARITQLLDDLMTRAQYEILGGISPTSPGDNFATCQGASFELCLTIPNMKRRMEEEEEFSESSAIQVIGECSFQLKVLVQATEHSATEHSATEHSLSNLGAYLYVNTRDRVEIVEFVSSFSVSSSTDEHCETKLLEGRFEKTFPSYDGLKDVMELYPTDLEEDTEFKIIASVFVRNIISTKRPKRKALLCSCLHTLRNEFTQNVEGKYSNHYFFSDAFRLRLSIDASDTQGGMGLPGRISGSLAIGVVNQMTKSLSFLMNFFSKRFHDECREAMEMMIGQSIDIELTPRLHDYVVIETSELLEKRLEELKKYHDKFLEWEQNIETTNHYFMDTVQSVRSLIFGSSDSNTGTNPAYLQHLTPSVIKKMSNEEQKLVDEQIEIFSYWKVFKKRFVDYVILSTHAELAVKPLTRDLKTVLLGRIFSSHDDDGLIKLMSPKDCIVRRRSQLKTRLDKLQQAMKEIKDFVSEHRRDYEEIGE